MKNLSKAVAQCSCGTVQYAAEGDPIVTVACYCPSCRTAGQTLEALPDAPPVRRRDSGTEFVLFRKDRVKCTAGHEHLKDYQLKPDSPTRRVVTTCCNTMMLLDFSKGHWLSLHRARLTGPAPAVQFGIMTAEVPGADLGDLPNHKSFPLIMLSKLIKAQVAMLLGPKVSNT